MSDWILPVLIAAVVCWGLLRGTPVYDSFVRGAGKGVQTSLSVLPCLAAIMVAVLTHGQAQRVKKPRAIMATW